MRWSSPRKRGPMTTVVRNCKTLVMDPGSGARGSSPGSLGRDDEYRYCFIHARPRRSLSRLRVALDRHLDWKDVRAQRRRRAGAAAAPRLRADQRDVAPRRAGADAAFHFDPSRSARLRLVGRAACERRSRALQQARHGGGDDRADGKARARALPPRPARPRRAPPPSAGARSPAPARPPPPAPPPRSPGRAGGGGGGGKADGFRAFPRGGEAAGERGGAAGVLCPRMGAGMRLREAKREDLPMIGSMLADDPLGAKRHRFEDPLPKDYYAA